MDVYLMNKNIPVIKLVGENFIEDIGIPCFKATAAIIEDRKRCPLCLSAFSDDLLVKNFNYWFEKRNISKKRVDLPSRPIEFEELPHYFSFSDQYWIKYNVNETWDDLSFFSDNVINNKKWETFGNIIFSKNLHNIETLKASSNTPDITTGGVLKKRWKFDGNKSILIKSMSKEFGQEPLNEILATKFLIKLNCINFVHYNLYAEGYELCCKCNNFITPNTELIPAQQVYYSIPMSKEEAQMSESERIYNHLIRAIKTHNIPNAIEFIDNMIRVDRLMLNFDRHLNNFGFIRNVNNGNFIEPAPLFDFGNCFFEGPNDKRKQLFAEREEELFKSQRINPLKDDFVSQFVKEVDEIDMLDNKKKASIITKFKKNNLYVKQRYAGIENRNRDKDIVQTAVIDI